MKKTILTILMAAVAMFSFTGCITLHSHTNIEKDGSGTFTMTMGITQEMADLMKEMAELEGGGGDQDMPSIDDFDKGKLKEAAKGHGVKVKKFEKSDKDGKQGLTLELQFENLEGLSYVLAATMGENEFGYAIFEDADGNYILEEHDYAFTDLPELEDDDAGDSADDDSGMPGTDDMDPEQMQKQMELGMKMFAAISELDVEFKITVPGDVINTTAELTEDRTSIWAINGANAMSMGNQEPPRVVFSGKGLKLKPLKRN